jgi:hypothetical protein
MRRYRLYRRKQQVLSIQIQQVERRLLSHQQAIAVQTATLIDKTQQQLSTPVNLLLASGVGFMIGELTKNQTNYRGAGSPLKTALHLVTSAQHLYAALPLIWLLKSFRQPYPSSPLASPQFQATAYDQSQ